MRPLPNTEFHGFSTQTLENEHLRVDFLATGGPRLVRILLPGQEENFLAEVPQLKTETPYGEYRFLGGHRLWHAPEDIPRTYIPDLAGLMVEIIPGGVRLTQPVEALTEIQKRMEIELLPNKPGLFIRHFLKNAGSQPVQLAPWAITQLPLGGCAVLPLPRGPIDRLGLLPNRNLVLWPYTRIKDRRLAIGDELILLHAFQTPGACKLGYTNRSGWAGYYKDGVFLLKRFTLEPDLPHPDFGCNVESYTGHNFIELETLGALVDLAPGAEIEHIERWEFFIGLRQAANLKEMPALLKELGLKN